MNILIKPLITEKMTAISEKYNRFGFIVDKRANKLQIKTAVENLYGVSIKEINTMVYAGKRKSRHTKTGFVQGRTNAYKKAIITLNEGETIDFYSSI